MELASDSTCPHREFFLSCLHVLSGDAVRTGFRAHRERTIRRLVAGARETNTAVLIEWAARTEALIEDPASFDHFAWCGGGFSREAIGRDDLDR